MKPIDIPMAARDALSSPSSTTGRAQMLLVLMLVFTTLPVVVQGESMTTTASPISPSLTTTTTTTSSWLRKASDNVQTTNIIEKVTEVLTTFTNTVTTAATSLAQLVGSSPNLSSSPQSYSKKKKEKKDKDDKEKKKRFIQKPCIPRQGHTAIAIGQDLDALISYTSAFASYQPFPYSVMSYTTLHSSSPSTYKNTSLTLTLPGLDDLIDYGSGKQWLKGLSEIFTTSSLQIGLNLVNQLTAIKQGDYDTLLDEFIITLNHTMTRTAGNGGGSTSSRRAVYLRIGYEFETPWNNYDPEDYKYVFRKIVRRFQELEVDDNVAFVWHAAVESNPRDNYHYDDWYPGDDVVDWCGISLFQQPYQCQSVTTNCFMLFPEQFVSYCHKTHEKPIMIAESTPFGGILDEKTLAKDPDRRNHAGYQGNTWNNWFTPVLEFIQSHSDSIRIWFYINCDWDALPMYQSEENHAPGVYWGDSRLEVHRDVKEQWINEVLSSKHMILSYDEVIQNPSLCELQSSSSSSGDDNNSHIDITPSNDDDFESRMRHTFMKELRKIVYGLLIAFEALLIVGFVIGVLVLCVKCLYKVCGGNFREHRLIELSTTTSGRKKYEYMVIEDHH